MAHAQLPDLACFLNGDYTRLPEAKISVMDRGFIFGDGVYEVVPVYRGQLFRFEQHMDRLERSLAELRIPNPMTRERWREVIVRLAEPAGAAADSELAYIQVTRGVAMRDHAMPADIEPTVFALRTPMRLPSDSQRAHGVSCVTAADFRWQMAHIKSTSLLGAVLARQISVDADAVETVMFRDDWLSEAASSNVWIVRHGKVMGPPSDNLVLKGIRYDLIDELCRDQGIAFELRRISRDEVLHADEILLSSATKEVLPVRLLDGQPVGTGEPGPIYKRLYAGYQSAKQHAFSEPAS